MSRSPNSPSPQPFFLPGEIQNRDTYGEHKHYFSLMDPVIAGTWANSPWKCQGEASTWKIQEEGWVVECGTSPKPI